MKRQELVKFLEENGENEYGLSESGVQYVIYNVSEEVGVSGYAIVSVEEGPLLIPYRTIDPDNGYEQLDIEDTRLVDKEEIESIIDGMEGTIEFLKKMFELK